MKKKLATIFSGGELFGVGAAQAGYEHIWGIELDDKISSVARQNGFNVLTGNVCDYTKSKIKKLERPDHFHASPPCPNFSNAKIGGEETALDIQIAEAVCLFIRTLLPESVSLENVVAYVYSESFRRIMKCLSDLGYMTDCQNINSADFGVPQTRIRMIVRARRGKLLAHYPTPVKWVGWLSAIEDLIPTLQDTTFAQWQLDRLPEKYLQLLTQSNIEIPPPPIHLL